MGKSQGQNRLKRMRYLCELTVKGTISIEEVDLTTVSQEDQHRIFQNYAMAKLNISLPIKGAIVKRSGLGNRYQVGEITGSKYIHV